jgi:predicted ArsR family transcriptional regulator
LVPRLLVLTAPQVADELAIPLKSARAALRDLEAVGILAEVGRLHRTGRGRPRQLFVSPELLGLVGSNPLRA